MNTLEKILESYQDEDILLAEGFDEAIIGIDSSSLRVVYSVSRCLDILGRYMSEEDASEHFYFNVCGSFVGDKTPIWCEDFLTAEK